MIVVGYGEANPTHDISLDDGETKIGLVVCNARGEHSSLDITRAPVPRTAMKTVSGNLKYSDYEPPWVPIAQDDWSGGRGMDDFEKDVTRYFDDRRVSTTHGTIILGPQERYTSGYRSQEIKLPGSVEWKALIGDTKYIGVKVTSGSSFSVSAIYVWLRRVGAPTSTLTVELCSDSAGDPGMVLRSATATTSTITDTLAELWKFSITAQALGSGIGVWVKIYANGTADNEENYWAIGCKTQAGTSKQSAAGASWIAAAFDIYYRLTDADDSSTPEVKFFKHKFARYMVRTVGSVAPKVYINGDRGAADANTGQLTKLIDATKSWATDQWAGCIVFLNAGTGSTEPKPWRTITANDVASLTVDSAWVTAHSTTTEYIILGSDVWTEITGHGLTANITDILSINNIVYFAQGDSTNMRRMQFTAASGHSWEVDGTNKVSKLCKVKDASNGDEVWYANNNPIRVGKAPVVNWGTNLTLSAKHTFKDDLGRINNLVEYGSPKALWILREGNAFALATDGTVPDEMPIFEMRTMMESTNGIAAIQHNNYLFFNVGNGLERYYSSTLDDVGPNRDEGLQSERQGYISALVGYAGRILAAVDAGDGYSTVLSYNLTGWNEIYRAPVAGQRIKALDFEVVPGSSPDRLWVQVGSDIIWLPFPSMTIKPTNDSNYRYTPEGVLTSGYMYAGMVEVAKLYNSLKVFSENLSDGLCLDAYYKLDTETTWAKVPGSFTVSPMDELKLGEFMGVMGKRLRWRIVLRTNDNTKTPEVKTVVLDTVARVPVKYSYAFLYRVGANVYSDLHGGAEVSPEIAQEKIDEWTRELTPLIMRANLKQFDKKTVFIDPPPLYPMTEFSEHYTGKLTLIEV